MHCISIKVSSVNTDANDTLFMISLCSEMLFLSYSVLFCYSTLYTLLLLLLWHSREQQVGISLYNMTINALNPESWKRGIHKVDGGRAWLLFAFWACVFLVVCQMICASTGRRNSPKHAVFAVLLYFILIRDDGMNTDGSYFFPPVDSV